MTILARFLLVVCLIFSISVSIAASPLAVKQFSGYVGDIKIYFDGKELDTSIQPVILEDGVTMVALRDLAEAMNYTVDWDTDTLSINIHSRPFVSVTPNYYWQNKMKQKIEDVTVIRNVGPFYQNNADGYYIASRRFTSGVTVDLDEKKQVAEVVLNLNHQYVTFEGYYGVDDQTMNSLGAYTLTVFGDDKEIFTSDLVKPSDYPRSFAAGEINLTNIKRLTFRIVWNDNGIGDFGLLTAVLANMNFYLK